jgi:hypothetical protein
MFFKTTMNLIAMSCLIAVLSVSRTTSAASVPSSIDESPMDRAMEESFFNELDAPKQEQQPSFGTFFS